MKIVIEIKDDTMLYEYETPAEKCHGTRKYSYAEMAMVCEIMKALSTMKDHNTKRDVLQRDAEMWICRNYPDIYGALMQAIDKKIKERPDGEDR